MQCNALCIYYRLIFNCSFTLIIVASIHEILLWKLPVKDVDNANDRYNYTLQFSKNTEL